MSALQWMWIISVCKLEFYPKIHFVVKDETISEKDETLSINDFSLFESKSKIVIIITRVFIKIT